MFYNYYDTNDYQYDSCVSKGICTSDPTTTALQEVILNYLKQISFYILHLKDLGVENVNIKKDIIETLSELISTYDYNQEQFFNIGSKLYNDLVQARALYKKMCNSCKIDPLLLKSYIDLSKKFSLSKAIKQGEKDFSKKYKELSQVQKDLYETMFLILKSVCINLTELNSFGEDSEKAYLAILNLLNSMNKSSSSETFLKEEIEKIAKIDYEIILKLYDLKKEKYGEIEPVTVSQSTKPNTKAILVEGTNIRELEKVLDAVKDEEIDVYTHGAMLLAHTYPKFRTYKNLIGQFGYGIENCLIDFATFPGAILLTKHSLGNIEYLYRGRLFTTDTFTPKGVVKIDNDNFVPLIASALSAKGFSKGKQRENLSIGFVESNLLKQAKEIALKIKNGTIKKLYIIGDLTNSPLQKDYFDKFLENLKDDEFAISLSYDKKIKNILYLNSFFDYTIVLKILNEMGKIIPIRDLPLKAFLTRCDKHVISNMLILKTLGVREIHLCKCPPTVFNPALLKTFSKIFGIETSV